MWIDRYFYRLSHPEVPDDGKLRVGFCPEGHLHTGGIEQLGEWKKKIVAVEPRYKKANEFIERKWASKGE